MRRSGALSLGSALIVPRPPADDEDCVPMHPECRQPLPVVIGHCSGRVDVPPRDERVERRSQCRGGLPALLREVGLLVGITLEVGSSSRGALM